MVLQEATADADAGFTTDSQPSSDIDPYASSVSSQSILSRQSRNGQTYNIRVDQLPKPFFLFNLSSDNDKAMYKTIADNCAHAQSVLQRPLKQEEVDAIGFHFAKSLRIVSYGMPAGGLLGAVSAYRGMSEYTFPFWKPKKEGSKFNPDAFGPIKGVRANMLWHVLRFNIYGFVGAVVGTMFFSTYATTVNAVGTATDPRLHGYIEALKKRGADQRGQIQRPVGQRNPVESQEGMMDRQAQGAARRAGMETTYSGGSRDVQRPVRDYDDQSPTGGAFATESRYHEEGGSPTDSGLLNDEQTRTRERTLQADAERSYVSRETANASSDNRTTARQPDSFDYDDASPTVASRASSSPFTNNSSGAGGSGSAWDRIRTNAGQTKSSSAPASQTQAEQKEGSTLGDSFAFSTTDEERQLAKMEAQRDFDARVERERNGGDFSQSGGGGYGGGNASASSGSGSAWERLRK